MTSHDENRPNRADAPSEAMGAGPGFGQAGEPATGQAARAAQALDEVDARLEEGELRVARRALVATRALVGPTDVARFEALEQRLALLEKLEGPTAEYEGAVARGDCLAARDWAALAVGLARGEEAAVWRARFEDYRARVQAEWRIDKMELDIDATGPALASCAGLLDTTDDVPPPLLADGGSSLVLVSSFGRWIFVREVDLEHRRLRRIGWLRAPDPLDDPSVQVDGNSIYLIGRSGCVLELSRSPLDVVRWLSLRPFMLPDRCVDDAFVVPPGRYLWAQLKEPGEDCGVAVVDTLEWRVCRRVHRSDFIAPVCGTKPPRMLALSLDEEAGLHDESGASIDGSEWSEASAPAYPTKGMVAHPGGRGMLALVAAFDSDGPNEHEDEARLGLLELRPGHQPSAVLVVAGTDHQQPAQLAVSLDERRAWLLTCVQGRNQLLAYRPAWNGIVEDWRAEVSSSTVLVRDADSRKVIALAPTDRGLDYCMLGSAPLQLEATPFGQLHLGQAVPPFYFCGHGITDRADVMLRIEADTQRRKGKLEQWAEARRKERRADPDALAELCGALAMSSERALAERLLAFSLDRHPAHPLLLLRRADVAAGQEGWADVECLLAGIEPGKLPEQHACHLYHLRGLARLHAGDARGARQSWSAGAALSPHLCCAEWNLDLADALLDPLDEEPEPPGSALRQVVRACRLADECFARGDAAAARDALERSVVHAALEVQSAARLAQAHLALEPSTPPETLDKAMALARFASIDFGRPRGFQEIPRLGWDSQRLARVAERAREWLERFARREAGQETKPADPTSGPLEPDARPGKPDEPRTLEAHSLPPLGHEAMRMLVPGLEAAVRDTVRYARAQPGWDETQTLGDDLVEFTPVRAFLDTFRARLSAGGMADKEALTSTELLGQHIDYCANFELHRRKLFFVDASLAWLLARTNLDIEGRVLRLPFPCFGVVFTDRATLELAQALLGKSSGMLADERLQILTAYVKRVAAPMSTSRLRLSLVFDTQTGQWPYLLGRQLDFADDDDLDAILDGFADTPRRRSAPQLLEMRQMVHLVVNAILYANSANVPWPLVQSPVRRLRAKAGGRGAAKKARAARRAQELGKKYSNEDVYHLPGRIPISQLRALQQVEREPEGREIIARFTVRGHWRRAARGWRDQRLRWIEPYWKGPELAAIIEKEYKLKI